MVDTTCATEVHVIEKRGDETRPAGVKQLRADILLSEVRKSLAIGSETVFVMSNGKHVPLAKEAAIVVSKIWDEDALGVDPTTLTIEGPKDVP